jgi:hypothetical protein
MRHDINAPRVFGFLRMKNLFAEFLRVSLDAKCRLDVTRRFCPCSFERFSGQRRPHTLSSRNCALLQ